MDVVLILLFLALFILSLAWHMGRSKRLNKKPLSFQEHFNNQSKEIVLDGIHFEIRKINVLDYLEGAKVLAENFAIYKTGKELKDLKEIDTSKINHLKKYLTDVICAGCVSPKFVRDQALAVSENEVPIEDLFKDWILAQKLAQEIFEYTYGKKN